MKIFLLVITILYLYNKIKATPQQLNENLYKEKMKESLDALKSQKIDGVNEDNMKILIQNMYNIFLFLTSLFNVIYYTLVANRFIDNTVVLLLSAIEIVTVIISYRRAMIINIYEADVEDNNHKFHRWYLLFNTVLDYIYYLFVIFMLLTN